MLFSAESTLNIRTMGIRPSTGARPPRCLLAAVLLCFASGVAEADNAPVPVDLQAVLLKKLLAYDKGMQDRRLKVLIIQTDKDPINPAEIASALSAVGIAASVIKPAELEAQAEHASVVYLSAAMDALREICIKHKLLSVSPNPTLAREGKVALALGKKSDGRPDILIHLERTRTEGHDFPANLLKLATVVQ